MTEFDITINNIRDNLYKLSYNEYKNNGYVPEKKKVKELN